MNAAALGPRGIALLGRHGTHGAMARRRDDVGFAGPSVIALARAINQMVLPHRLGHKIHLAVSTEAGIAARHIVLGDHGGHAVGKIMQLEGTALGCEQQTFARVIEHGVIGGSLHALEQPLARDHFHLLCHNGQHHRRHQHHNQHSLHLTILYLFHIHTKKLKTTF